MGTWGDGLWDGDAQLDAIADFTHGIWARIEDLAQRPANAANAGRLAALVGVLLHLSETYSLSLPEHHEALMAALDKQAPASHALSAGCRRLMRRVHAGEGAALAARYGRRSGKLARILGGYLDGLRRPALFAHPAGVREVQALVDDLAQELDDGLTPDLYRAAAYLALFGLILYLEPAYVAPQRLNHWVRVVERAAPLALESEDREFWQGYLKNVREGFELCRQRCGTRVTPPEAPPATPRPRDLTPWVHLRRGEPSASAFWSIARHGHGFTEHSGDVGSEGKERVSWFASAAAAQAELERRVAAQREAGFADAKFDEEVCSGWVRAEIERERARQS
ncbi:MAG: hypothetical protein KDD82_19270 [Planctomycetes bacterium]|nr:hypothetical protein [Planctomycetota bacterium]